MHLYCMSQREQVLTNIRVRVWLRIGNFPQKGLIKHLGIGISTSTRSVLAAWPWRYSQFFSIFTPYGGIHALWFKLVLNKYRCRGVSLCENFARRFASTNDWQFWLARRIRRRSKIHPNLTYCFGNVQIYGIAYITKIYISTIGCVRNSFVL